MAVGFVVSVMIGFWLVGWLVGYVVMANYLKMISILFGCINRYKEMSLCYNEGSLLLCARIAQ